MVQGYQTKWMIIIAISASVVAVLLPLLDDAPAGLLRDQPKLTRAEVTLQEGGETYLLEITHPETVAELDQSIRDHRDRLWSPPGPFRYELTGYAKDGSEIISVNFSVAQFGEWGITPQVLAKLVEDANRNDLAGWRKREPLPDTPGSN